MAALKALIFALCGAAVLFAPASAQYDCAKVETIAPEFSFVAKDQTCGETSSDPAKSQKYVGCESSYCPNPSSGSTKCTAFQTYKGDCSSVCLMNPSAGVVVSGSCIDKKCYYTRVAGDACEDDKDCSAGKGKCTNNKCVAPVEADKTCTTTSDCPEGYGCGGGKCVKVKAVGADCNPGTDVCAAGSMCNDKKCVMYRSLDNGKKIDFAGYSQLCKSGYAEGTECKGSRTNGVKTGEVCTGGKACTDLDAQCICTGNKESKCMKMPNADPIPNYSCMTTSGCNPASNANVPNSCMSKCAMSSSAAKESVCDSTENQIWMLNGGKTSSSDAATAASKTYGVDCSSSSGVSAVVASFVVGVVAVFAAERNL